MKIKTSELKDAALDWAVAKCEGTVFKIGNGISTGRPLLQLPHRGYKEYSPSSDWYQGGPIIEREGLWLCKAHPTEAIWGAQYSWQTPCSGREWFGPTPLIAAMRCYVASKLGDEVEIPEELAS